ncbi:hypothetical protein HETIRDRAFT_126085 [Heterobasidion irregulare TC 32-1]|uniref:DUF7137 domain-containing protein n=1 Tax=Heterobasidion irregulare (strain TC 32-1) TaxID=747525 RepID=W4JRD5_HETIT|nr:uncharacterized protein HETIRDRAFT_126085 [Heterobasidion irregulare TC 32-1]ETW76103.1 hypothetical protein HETIRDRAFT_126085 [Heterobasidion irregulare TC 32-1]
MSSSPRTTATSNSGSLSGSASGSVSGSASGSATTSSISIPQTAAAGGLTITSPPQTTIAFFKLASAQPITFAWNLTSLYSTPAHLTLSAVCDNGITYPVGPTDGVIPGTQTSVVWDAWAFQQSNPASPLPQATFTLNIFDERGMGAAREPGLFSPNNALKFALYTPQAYTPIASGWTCSGCKSDALAAYTAHPAFVGIFATMLAMFLSGLAVMRHGMH